MPLTFEEVEDWTRKTDTLEALQDELSQRTTTLSGLQDQLSDIRRLDGWQGNTLNITPNTFPIGLDNSSFHTKAIVPLETRTPPTTCPSPFPAWARRVNAGKTIEGMVREGALLRSEAVTQLERAGRANETVATVAWLGYDTPRWSDQAGSDNLAHAGAAPLSHYLQSVDVTTTDADQHLTLVGHSYGSLTSGLALQHRANAVVDDYVAYGSPGFYAIDECQLGMQQGHVFVMQAADDPIRVIAERPMVWR